MLPRRILVPILVAGVIGGGCSTFEGRRLAPDERLPGQETFFSGGGIPYSLPAPEYTLQRAIIDGHARYTVAVGYAPDPNQRYTIRVDPGFLSSVGFNVDLGERGEVAVVGATTKDQIVPTIKAVGTIVGAMAPMTMMPLDIPPSDASAKIDNLQNFIPPTCNHSESNQPDSLSKGLVCIYIKLVEKKKPRRKNIDENPYNLSADMIIFAQRYIIDYFGNPLPTSNNVAFRNDLHARSLEEQGIIIDIYNERAAIWNSGSANNLVVTGFKNYLGKLTYARDNLNDNNKKTCDNWWKELSTDAKILSDQLKQRQTDMIESVARQALVGRPGAFHTLLKVPGAPPCLTEQATRNVARALLVAVAPGPAQPKDAKPGSCPVSSTSTDTKGIGFFCLWQAASDRKAELDLLDTLREAATVGPDEWRARHLRYLNLRLAEIGQRDLLAGPETGGQPVEPGDTPRTCPPPPPLYRKPSDGTAAPPSEEALPDAYARCVEERAWTIDAYDTLRRLHLVEKGLVRILPPTAGDEVGLYEEYARLEEVAARLRARLAEAASKVAQAGQPPGIRPFDPKRVPIVARACVIGGPDGDGCRSPHDWPADADDAEFVITLTKITGAAR